MRKQKYIKQKRLGVTIIMGLVISTGGIFYSNMVKAEDVKPTLSEYIEQTREINKMLNNKEQIKNNENMINQEIKNTKQKPNYNISLDEKYQDLIWELCNKNNFSYELALAVMYQESKFNANEVNVNMDSSRDGGLYQLNDRSIKDIKEYAIQYCGFPENKSVNVLDPEDNIRLGIGNLVHLRNYYKEKGVNEEELIYWVAGSYQRGKQGFKNYVSRNGYLESSYSNKVLYYKTKLEREGSFE